MQTKFNFDYLNIYRHFFLFLMAILYDYDALVAVEYHRVVHATRVVHICKCRSHWDSHWDRPVTVGLQS